MNSNDERARHDIEEDARDPEPVPTCDHCGEPWEDGGEGDDWNPETGCHFSCEAQRIPDEPLVIQPQHNHDGPGDCPVCPTDYETDPGDGATLIAGVLYDDETGEEAEEETEGTRIVLQYTVPLYVQVNVTTREIEKVWVDDSADPTFVPDGDHYNRDGMPEPTDAVITVALELADGKVRDADGADVTGGWPEWEWGA